MPSRRGSRSIRSLLGVGLPVLATFFVITSWSARADTREPNQPQSTAILTPLFLALQGGDTVGLPLVCLTGVGALSGGAAGFPGGSAVVGPIASVISKGCASSAAEGATQLQQAMTQVAPLAPTVNPVANPLIATGAQVTDQAGQNIGPGIAPFGPTVQGLAAFLVFFEGS